LLKSVLKNKRKRLQIKETSEQGENGGFAWLKATGYTSIRIINSKDYPKFIGKYLSEIATAKNMNSFEALCDLIINSNGKTFITLGGIDENDVQELLIQPWNMISSDGYNLDQSKPHSGHPRSTGSFPRVLGHYVRDLQLISLEEAIRKMTSLPADFIGLKSRGRIKNGQPADIVIFNAETITDHSTYELPTEFSTGVIHVFVNGVQVLKDEIMTGNAPGHFLNRKNEGYDK
jgi:N-acyl-D-amino-acid deacylase